MPIEYCRDGPWALPEGWVWARLGSVCQVNEPTSFDELPDDLEIPFVPMAAVAEETGVVDITQRRPVSQLRKGYTRFRSGDVIFAKITPCMENGKTAALLDLPGGYAAGSTEFHVLRSRILDARYLWYWLVRKAFRDDARLNMSGSAGQLRVPVDYLRDSEVAVPPVPEQRRIVARIDELFTEIADGETALAKARDDLDTWRRALLKAAVTGDLTREWRESAILADSGADVLQSVRAKRDDTRVSTKRRRFNLIPPNEEIRFPAIPDSWAWGQLGDFLYDIEAGLNVKAEGRSPREGETGIVKISAVTWDEFDENESKTLPPDFEADECNVIRPGDFLISRANTLELVGAPVIVKSCERQLVLSDKVLRLRLVEGFERWIELCLKSPIGRQQIEQYASGNQLSMRNITQENIARIAIPIPPQSEMEYAIELYTRSREHAEDGSAAISDSARTAKSVRQSILKSAFEGRLVEQDPREEPADRLLARLSEQADVLSVPRRRTRGRRAALAAE